MTKTKSQRKPTSQRRKADVSAIRKLLEDLAKERLPRLDEGLEEVAHDNMSLLGELKQLREEQEASRSAANRELKRLQEEVGGAFLFPTLTGYCRELAPVLNALERMLKNADFSDGRTIRHHVESLLLTLKSVLNRMGIEQISIVEGRDAFDSNVHDCIRTCTARESPFPEASPGTVVRVEEHGYTLTGKPVLPARVWVQAWGEEVVPSAGES